MIAAPSPKAKKRRRLSPIVSPESTISPDLIPESFPFTTSVPSPPTPERSRSMAYFPESPFPAAAVVTPTQSPLVSRSFSTGSASGRKRLAIEEEEEEHRQDMDSLRRRFDTRRISPRSSPIAVLKLRRTNLFPEDEGKPTKPITVTYSPSFDSYDNNRDEISSRSLANSMFLVSPLRPLTRQRICAPPPLKTSVGLKASLIDSSESILRPLTPLSTVPRPQRSLSESVVLDGLAQEGPISNDKKTQQFAELKEEPVSTGREATRQWLIPAEHPYKVLWDVLTFILSFVNALATHNAIASRQFGNSWFMTFCEAWFVCDILLNFFTEYRSDTYIIRDNRSVCARYLTTWFVIDVLSLFPGEVLYLKPLIDKQNRRNFFTKNFFRTKAVVRVTRILRGRHFKMFGRAARHTKHAGVGAARLLQLLIKYIPKYLMFFRNMKGVLALRMLRQIHWFRKVWRLHREKVTGQPEAPVSLRKLRQPEYNEDDDGAPF